MSNLILQEDVGVKEVLSQLLTWRPRCLLHRTIGEANIGKSLRKGGTLKKYLAGDLINHLSIKLLPKPVGKRAKTLRKVAKLQNKDAALRVYFLFLYFHSAALESRGRSINSNGKQTVNWECGRFISPIVNKQVLDWIFISHISSKHSDRPQKDKAQQIWFETTLNCPSQRDTHVRSDNTAR